MELIEAQYDGGATEKKECDFCMEEPENGVLIEKPMSLIVEGRKLLSRRFQPIYICLGCLEAEIEDTIC